MSSVQQKFIDAFKDIKNIEVITAVAEDVELTDKDFTEMDNLKNIKINKVSYYARTTLELEGDSFTLLPGPQDDKAAKVAKIHEESTKNAVETWNNMVRVALTGVAIAAELSGHGLGDKTLDLISRVGFIPKKD